MKIKENQVLELNNVLVFEGELTQRDFATKLSEIERTLRAEGVMQCGPMISCKDTNIMPTGEKIYVKLLIPLNREIKAPAGFSFMKVFKAEHLIMMKFNGNPATLPKQMGEVEQYMAKRRISYSKMYTTLAKPKSGTPVRSSVESDIYFEISQ